MKRFLLILCACAVILTFGACKKKNNTEAPDETGEAIETSDVIADDTDKSDETKKSTDSETGNGSDTEEAADDTSDGSGNSNTSDTTGTNDSKDTSGTADTTEPDDSSVTNETTEPDDPGDEKDTEKDTDNTKDTETPVADMGVDIPEVVTPGGTEPGLWPADSIPSDVPAYDVYSEMYTVTHDEHEESEEWYLSFDSTEEAYEDYLEKLADAGYIESDKIVGFWGNGNQILNLFTEDVDGEFCVSIDIFKSKPVNYPKEVLKVFPEFKVSDSTLYGWYVLEEEDCNTLSVSYACGKDFFLDLSTYKQQLSDAGFTVTEDEATIEKDGKTYIVRYGDNLDAYEDSLEYVYY